MACAMAEQNTEENDKRRYHQSYTLEEARIMACVMV